MPSPITRATAATPPTSSTPTPPTAPAAPTVKPTTPTTPATQGAGGAMGKDQFLQLLIAQMKNQDPLNPMDGTQMAAQLAQFSTVEQLQSANTTLTQISDALRVANAGTKPSPTMTAPAGASA